MLSSLPRGELLLELQRGVHIMVRCLMRFLFSSCRMEQNECECPCECPLEVNECTGNLTNAESR